MCASEPLWEPITPSQTWVAYDRDMLWSLEIGNQQMNLSVNIYEQHDRIFVCCFKGPQMPQAANHLISLHRFM